jgi:hypothetical protein
VIAERIDDVDAALAEAAEFERILAEDRRTSDPARGVLCVFGCADRPCRHTAYLVETIRREEDR